MSMDGSWKVTIKGPMGAMATTLVIKSDGDSFIGTQSGQGQSSAITDGKVAGDQVTWSNQITTPMKMKFEYSGVLAGNQISGKVKAGFMGSFPFTGARES
jgi:hypothetical protein